MTSVGPAAAIRLAAWLTALLALLPSPARTEARDGDDKGILSRAAERVERVYREGRNDLYVSGLYWHLPFAYSHDKRRELNDDAWGLGLGRTVIDARDNEASVYAMASRSSHFEPQYVVGYSWLARWRVSGDLRFGAGYTAIIFARSDIYHYTPLPGVVPMASLGTDRVTLLVTYLPRINDVLTGRGNVVYAVLRFAWD